MKYILNRMTWQEAKEQIEKVPVAILPVGATEQHGYHLPLGTDIFLAEHLAGLVSEKTGCLVLPSMNFGYSWVWRDRVGTVSLSQHNLQEVLKDVARSVCRYGVKVLIYLSAHEANSATLKYAVREISDEVDIKVLGMFYPGWQKVYNQYMESDTWGGMFHACEFETSLMMSVNEEYVHMERAVKEYPERPVLYGMDNTSIGDLSVSGTYGDPTVATKEKGEKMFEIFAENISALIREIRY